MFKFQLSLEVLIIFKFAIGDGTDNAVDTWVALGDCDVVNANILYGCIDPTALNFSPYAQIDDGSCIGGTAVYGCTDILALNYNQLATIDDGSCIYSSLTCQSIVDNNATCGNNGCATVSVSGGTLPYDYVWYDTFGNNFSATQNSPFLTNQKCNLLAGNYYCIVTDALGITCTTSTVTITNTAAQLNTYFSNNISCNGYCDGEIISNPINGSGNYSFSWSDDPNMGNILSTTNTLSNACSGTYYIELNDFGNSCIDTFTVILTQPAQVNLVVDSITNLTCNSSNSGSIYSTLTGGSLPYQNIIWTGPNGFTDSVINIFNLEAGIYQLNVEDNNGCTELFAEILLDCYYGCTDSIAINFNPTSVVDNNTCIYPIYGCTDSLAINFNPLANTNDGSCILPLLGCMDSIANNYNSTATVDDGTCCYYTTNFNDSIFTCFDTINLFAIDSLNYSYFWNIGSLSNNINVTLTNLYILNIYDSMSGCNDFDSVFVQFSAFDTSLNIFTQSYDATIGNNDGAYNVTATGGSPPYTITYQNNPIGVYAGVYDVLVEDFAGCQEVVTVAINESCPYNLTVISQPLNSLEWTLYNSSGVQILDFQSNIDTICLVDDCYSLSINETDTIYNQFDFILIGNDTLQLGQGIYSNDFPIVIGQSNCYVIGCTNPIAINYNIHANIDDGSCQIIGCTNDLALNFNPNATIDDGTCITSIQGCTDTLAINYIVNAIIDDGSCVYPCSENIVAINFYDSAGDGWNGAQLIIKDSLNNIIYSGTLIDNFFKTDTVCLNDGCYELILNGGLYDNEIFIDIDSYLNISTTSSFYFSIGNSSCNIINGCMDSTALNYNSLANFNDNSCVYACSNYTFVGYDMMQDGWNGGYVQIMGPDTFFITNYNQFISFSETICLVNGCYDIFVGGGVYPNEMFFSFDPLHSADILPSGTYSFIVGNTICPIYGCTQPIAINFDSIANTDDGSCIVYGCLNPTASNYNPMANVSNNNCQFLGCLDTLAFNFDSIANIDDGSCQYIGCTDINADNYDSNATDDDGSCIYCSTFALSIDSQSDATAVGAADGSATVTASGGTSPYSINWPADPSSLAAGTYTVTATDAEGCTTSIDVTIDEPSTAVCSAPTGLNTFDVVHTRATFNFTSTGADYYKIRVKENGGAWQVITQLGTATGTPGGSTKTKYFLTADASYEWQVRAWCIDGQVSGWSTSAFFNTLPECPNATNQYASDIEAEWAVLNWDAPTNTVAGVNYYLARIQEDGASSWNIVTPANGGTDNFKLKGQLIPGATYNFETRTWCNTGDANNPTDPYYKSDWGGSASFTTVPCPVQTFNLYTSNVNATTQFFGADFVADGNVHYDHFTLRFREVGATAWQFRSITAAHIAAGGRNVGGLTTAVEYEWGIRTFCGAGST